MKFLFILVLFTNILFANVGKIVALKGEANITRENKTFQVTKNTLLKEKDILNTKRNSKVQILFQDETIISIGQNSIFKINDYIFENKDNVKAEFSMIKGVFRTITGKIGKIAPQNFKLKTKSASIGIRGTQIITDLTDGKERIFCTEGQIEVTQNLTNLKIIVNKGEFIAMDENTSNQLQKSTTTTKDLKEVNQEVSVSDNKAEDTVSLQEVTTDDLTTTVSSPATTIDANNSTNVIVSSAVEVVEESNDSVNDSEKTEEVERVADELAAAEAQKLTDIADAKLAQEQADAAEAQRLADIAADELAQEQADAAEAQRLDDQAQEQATAQIALDVSTAAASNAATAAKDAEDALVQATLDAQATLDQATSDAQAVLDAQAALTAAEDVLTAAAEADKAAAQSLVDDAGAILISAESAASNTATAATTAAANVTQQKLDAFSAISSADNAASSVFTDSLEILTPDSYYDNNDSKAIYTGDFNSTPFDNGRQYIKYDDDDKISIPTDTTISMDIDFGKSDNQVSNGKITISGKDNLEFNGYIKDNNDLKLSATNETSGGGGSASFYGPNGNTLEGTINLKNDDVKLEGDFEADKGDYIDLTDTNNLDELTSLDYFEGNNSYATYTGDFNDYAFDSQEQYKEVLGVRYSIPENATISMGIDFSKSTNQISNGLITQNSYFTTDFRFDGLINDDKSFTLNGSGNTEGIGSGKFYGNNADVIKGQVDMHDMHDTYGILGVGIKGKFEASKE